jgi:hypothetical protein
MLRFGRMTMKNKSFWRNTVTRALSIYACLIFVVLWTGFFIALGVDREWLDILWDWVQGLPSLLRILVWVLLLPIMVGLWIWESSWPTLVRLVGFAGIAIWTLNAASSLYKAFGKTAQADLVKSS